MIKIKNLTQYHFKILPVKMLLLLLLSIFSYVSLGTSIDCTISTNGDLGEPQPLIVNLNYTIRHPQTTDEVFVYENEDIILSCPGSNLLANVGGETLTLSEHETATCAGAKLFTIGSNIIYFTNITCVQYPIDVIRATNNTCEGGRLEIEIGYLVHSTYIRHLRICFDDKAQTTFYSHFELMPTIRGRQSGFPRPSWTNDDFFTFGSNSSNSDANALLVNRNQIATISNLIGYNSTTTNPYVNNTADLYLARGHLTAKADFVFGAQQRATFHMVNAVPQWQTFNGRNWAYLENDVRSLASDYELTLQTYTGTYGVMSLPHVETNEEVEIYLYNDDNGHREFPAPLLFWKFLYEPIAQAGIVLVGVNHPYIKNVSEAVVCEDIYDSLNWTTTFSRNSIINGYMYVCAPADFNKTVIDLPNLPVNYLLTLNSTYNSTDSSAVRLLAHSFTGSFICIVFGMLVTALQ